jgi:2-haloacid dehalogenase
MEFEVVAFDVFGTLVDWRSTIAAELSRVGTRAGLQADWPAVADAWRARYRPTLEQVLLGNQQFQTLDVLHAAMLEDVIAAHGLQSLGPDDRAELVLAWHRLRPWPDSVPGLDAMRQRYILTPLSNGGVGLLTRLAKSAGLPFDCILSAELAGTYKPDPQVYHLPGGYFGLRPDQVLMVACHPSDLAGAKQAGLRTAYVPRPLEWGPAQGPGAGGQPQAGSAPPPPPDVDFAANDLIELAEMVNQV